MSGDRRLIPGDRRLIPGNRRLIPGDRRLIPGDRRLMPEDRRLMPEDRRPMLVVLLELFTICIFSYLNLDDVAHNSINKFLSDLVDKALFDLQCSYCLELGKVRILVQVR